MYSKHKTRKHYYTQGGTNFLHNYEKNIIKIQHAIEKYSGKHSMDMALAEQFMNGQHSKVRKQAARDLIENTIYITLKEVSSIIEQLILQFYANEKNANADEIYFYTGNPEKSFYFMSILALFYIRKHGFKEPIFVKTITDELFDKMGGSPMIILDDVAYSGAQLSMMLNNFYYQQVVKNKKTPPNIFILLIALNDFSKAKLSKVPIKRSGRIDLEFKESPFHLIYLPERLYTPLIIKLGIERYFYLNVFFSPYTGNVPYISLYLDHKIADEASTYTTALLYAPIVPTNYDYHRFFVWTDYQIEIIPDKSLLPKEALDILNEQNNTTFKFNQNAKILEFLIQKLTNLDIFSDTATENQFLPFINTCNQSKEILKNTKDKELLSINYALFMIPEGCLEKNKGCVLLYMDLEEFIEKECALSNISKTKAIEISNKIHHFKCPTSWYKKEGFFELQSPQTQNKKSRSHSRSKSRSHSRSKSRSK